MCFRTVFIYCIVVYCFFFSLFWSGLQSFLQSGSQIFFQESERVVTKKEGINFAREYGCLFIECSAKTRANVQQCFEELVLKVLKTLIFAAILFDYLICEIKLCLSVAKLFCDVGIGRRFLSNPFY